MGNSQARILVYAQKMKRRVSTTREWWSFVVYDFANECNSVGLGILYWGWEGTQLVCGLYYGLSLCQQYVPRNLAQTRLSFICESDHQLGEEVIEDIKAIIVRGQECWYMKGCGDN